MAVTREIALKNLEANINKARMNVEVQRQAVEAHRIFESGAFRNNDTYKDDYAGYLSPLAIEAFGKFMTKNRFMEDGTQRDSDNWQKGIPNQSFMKSLVRHVLQVWKGHDGFPADETLEDALCAVVFNAMGYLHNLKKAQLPSQLPQGSKREWEPGGITKVEDPESPFWDRKEQMDPIYYPGGKTTLLYK